MDTRHQADIALLRPLIDRLFTPLSDADGTPEADLAAAEARLGFPLPPLLRAYYLAAGGRDDLNREHDRLFPAEFLAGDDGVLAFLSASDGARCLGVSATGEDAGQSDPPVLACGAGSGATWKPVRATLCDALRDLLLANAANGGMSWYGAVEVPTETADAALSEAAGWERVPAAASGGGKSAPTFFLGDGMIVQATPAKKGNTLVCAGARTAAGLQAIAGALEASWSEKRRRPDAPPEADEGLVDEHAEARRALQQRAARTAAAATAGSGEICGGCGARLSTWADTGRGVCGLCGQALPAGDS